MEPINLWLILLGVFAIAAVGVLKLIERIQDRKRCKPPLTPHA